MSKKDEALKLALEYITQSGFQTGINEVIAAIREALAEQPAHPDCDCGRELHEMHMPGCAYAKSKVEAATRDQQARYRAHIEDEWRKLNAEQPVQQHDRVRELECVIADLQAECKELRAQQQEPVALQEIARLHDRIKDLEQDVEFLSRPAQQEPVAYMNPDDLEKMKRFGRGAVAWATPTDFCTKPVYTSPPNVPTARASKPLTDEQREKLRDAFAQALTSVYVCGRVWEAWQYGTMSEGDFQPASECEEVLDALIEAAHGIKEKNA